MTIYWVNLNSRFSVIRLHALQFVPLKKAILLSQPIGIIIFVEKQVS